MTGVTDVIAGKRIKQLRERNGITQDELAKRLNCTRSTIAMIEIGKRGLTPDHLTMIADFFNVSCDYIIRGIEAANLDFSAETGLTHNAIEELKHINKSGLFGTEPDTIEEVANDITGEFLSKLITSKGFKNAVRAYAAYDIKYQKLESIEAAFIDKDPYLEYSKSDLKELREKTDYRRYQLTKAIEQCFIEE